MGAALTCCQHNEQHEQHNEHKTHQIQLDNIVPILQLQRDIQLVSPLTSNECQTSPPLSLQSAHKIYERARYIASHKHEALAWQTIDGKRTYYFNCLTSKVSLSLPYDVPSLTLSDQHLKPSIACFPDLINICSTLDIKIEFGTSDPYYRSLLQCQPPSLCSALYAIPLVIRVLQAYPIMFWPDVCQRIVLCDDITFDGVVRDAVPVSHSRSLYISVKRHERVFYMSMIHHEIFHLIDAVFFQSINQSHPVDSEHACDYDDPEWLMLNTPGFQYGLGGDKLENRSSEMSMSGSINGTQIPNGFVSRYSMSDPAEDRAEIFSSMMRNPTSLNESSDLLLQQKSDVIRQRVRQVCSSFDSVWWNTIEREHMFPLVEGPAWISMKDANGRQFWFNTETKQSAVIK